MEILMKWYIQPFVLPSLKRVLQTYGEIRPSEKSVVDIIIKEMDKVTTGLLEVDELGFIWLENALCLMTLLNKIDHMGDLFMIHLLAENIGLPTAKKPTEYQLNKNRERNEKLANQLGIILYVDKSNVRDSSEERKGVAG